MTDHKIEYRVRPVTRYIVTRYEETAHTGASTTHGEYDSEEVAQEVGYALCKAEHDRLGWSPSDERIQYPRPVIEAGPFGRAGQPEYQQAGSVLGRTYDQAEVDKYGERGAR